MFSLIKRCLAASLLLIGSLAQAADFKAGVHYDVLDEPVTVLADGKVHVEEAFWYGCPHCFHLEEKLKPWVASLPADVEFSRVPAMFGRAWVQHAKLYYTAEALGVLDKVHESVFRAFHLQKERLLSEDDQRDFLVENAGISEKDFDKVYDSFTVKSRMKQGDKRIRSFKISGVPALIVNGKYIVSASTAGGQDKMTAVVDHLIEKERQAVAAN
tara:strand:- start:166 stop:807 length:642 start_codon:yes stop_codon:yes gene_type:complete